MFSKESGALPYRMAAGPTPPDAEAVAGFGAWISGATSLIERCGLPGQRIFHDIHLALDRQLHYFTTLIVRRYPLEHIV